MSRSVADETRSSGGSLIEGLEVPQAGAPERRLIGPESALRLEGTADETWRSPGSLREALPEETAVPVPGTAR